MHPHPTASHPTSRPASRPVRLPCASSPTRPLRAAMAALLAATTLACHAASPASGGLSSAAPGAAKLGALSAQALAQGPDACGRPQVQEAVQLIYQQGDVPAASNLARHCEDLAARLRAPASKTIAARIRALIAMRLQDMPMLKTVGESLVAQAQDPEYVADGHLFVAMACLFGGDAPCARSHVAQARALYTELKLAEGLQMLGPYERSLEAWPASE